MVFAPEHAREVRVALRVIVSEYGSEALSQPAMIARLLAAAAQDRVAETLHDHVSHGMDPATAARLAASSFAAATLFAPEACAWVAGELVLALGLVTSTAAESLDEEIAPPEAFALAARPAGDKRGARERNARSLARRGHGHGAGRPADL